MRFLKQSLVLLCSFLFVYGWQNTPLSQYTLQFLIVVVAAYLLLTIKRRFEPLDVWAGGSLSIFILVTAVLLFVFSTGALNSGVFFLLYFLGFGLTFAFEPGIVFVFTLFIFLLFLPEALGDDVISNFIRLAPLLLISPIAFFFGREFKKERSPAAAGRARLQAKRTGARGSTAGAETVQKKRKGKRK